MKTKLLAFIDSETARYVEPMRQGTTKGDPIGLSSNKYKSTLLFLTNLKGKEIAEAVNVSYGLLRVWRTEAPYLSAIERHMSTFAGMVVKHIFEILEDTKTKGPSGEVCFFVTGTEVNDRLAQDFADIALYSDHLMNEIYKQARAKMFDDLTVFHTFMSYLGLIFALRKGYCLPLTGQSVQSVLDSPIVKERQAGLIFFDFIEALQRPWTPDEEKAEQVKVSFLKAM